MDTKITKENVLSAIKESSNYISEVFDKRYSVEIEDLSTELAHSYEILYFVMNREDQSTVSNQDFQSASLFWTGLNTILAGIDLFRRGYSKEPQMLLRDALEIFASAYEIHKDIDKYNQLIKDPKNYDSTKAIKTVKEIHPILGNYYGMLSDKFAHVSTMHLVPHNSDTPLAIGGIYDPKRQHTIILGIISFLLTVDILNSVLEFSLIKYIDNPKSWKKVDNTTYQFIHDKKRIDGFLEKMKAELNSMNIKS